MEERTLIVTPAMRAKIEELTTLILGTLPGYKMADITLSVTMVDLEAVFPGEKRSTCRVLLRQPAKPRAAQNRWALENAGLEDR